MSEAETMDAPIAQPASGLRSWEPSRRRTSSLVAMGIAIGFAVVALVAWFLAPDSAWLQWLDWALVVLLVLVLAFIVLLMAMGGAKTQTRTPESETAEPHMGPSGPMTPGDTVPVAQTMTLRCGDCGTVFDITDTGERPLYHTCPGCGAQGVLKADEAQAEAKAEATPMAPMPEPEPAPMAPAPAPAAAPPAPAAPQPRRLKLRCGGCKEVFVIEDTGERPLRRPCPHCGRMGEIR